MKKIDTVAGRFIATKNGYPVHIPPGVTVVERVSSELADSFAKYHISGWFDETEWEFVITNPKAPLRDQIVYFRSKVRKMHAQSVEKLRQFMGWELQESKAILESGFILTRGGEIQFCPWTDHHPQARCGTWCPHFRIKADEISITVLLTCADSPLIQISKVTEGPKP